MKLILSILSLVTALPNGFQDRDLKNGMWTVHILGPGPVHRLSDPRFRDLSGQNLRLNLIMM